MKRMLSLVLVLALLFALEIPVFAGDAGLQNFSPATAYVPFSDVPADAWYAENVKTVCEYGLMQGKGQGKFMPSGKLSVAETLAIACRLHNIFQGGDGVIGQSAPWYQSYIDYAAEYEDHLIPFRLADLLERKHSKKPVFPDPEPIHSGICPARDQ